MVRGNQGHDGKTCKCTRPVEAFILCHGRVMAGLLDWSSTSFSEKPWMVGPGPRRVRHHHVSHVHDVTIHEFMMIGPDKGRYLIRLICFSLIARMKSGSGMNPTASMYLAALPPSTAIDQSRKCRMAPAVAASGCLVDTSAYS